MTDPINLLLPKLEGVRKTGSGSWMARCPAHEDRLASLSVREAPDGRVLIYCFAGCGATDVVLSVGLDLVDLFPPRQTISYKQTRLRDPDIPRVSASDALHLLDAESFYVLLVAEALAGGGDLGAHRDELIHACARIAEVRQLWEMQP